MELSLECKLSDTKKILGGRKTYRVWHIKSKQNDLLLIINRKMTNTTGQHKRAITKLLPVRKAISIRQVQFEQICTLSDCRFECFAQSLFGSVPEKN